MDLKGLIITLRIRLLNYNTIYIWLVAVALTRDLDPFKAM